MMSAVHVAYHYEQGWSAIDAASYDKPTPDGAITYCLRRFALNDGDTLRLRATFDRPQHARQLDGLTTRAEQWLIDADLATKQRGWLIVNWPEVEKERERLAVERREVA